jgi:hypothetical protein
MNLNMYFKGKNNKNRSFEKKINPASDGIPDTSREQGPTSYIKAVAQDQTSRSFLASVALHGGADPSLAALLLTDR